MFVTSVTLLLMAALSNTIEFERHEVDAFPSGYQVAVADLTGNGRPDIAALSTQADRVDWYENGTWRSHPIARTARNIDLAFHDVNEDGRPEMALAAGFYFNEPERGGEILLLGPGSTASSPWLKRQIATNPVVHRIRWGDLDGDGRKELVHAPIFGPGSKGAVQPSPAHLLAFVIPVDWRTGEIRSAMIDETLTVLHGVSIGDLNSDGRDEVLTASFEGIHRLDLEGDLFNGHWRKTLISAGAAPLTQAPGSPRGSSEVASGRFSDNSLFIAAIEPWHGHEVVLYTSESGVESWQRHVLDSTLDEGHALAVADFDDDGTDEIVAGWRGGEGGLRMYDPSGEERRFRTISIDHEIAVEGVAVADINLDGRLDLIALGGRTNNLVWYENHSH